MSNTGTPAPRAIIPSITGNPLVDTLLRGAILASSAWITAALVSWANAHGFQGPDIALEIGGAVLAFLVTVATLIWSYVQTQLNKTAVAHHVITAVATGEIPNSVVMAAENAKGISGHEITKALTNAETIKG